MTAEELLHRPDDGKRSELIAGRLRLMEPGGYEHGRVSLKVGALLFAHVREHDDGVVLGAETGFVLARDPDTVRAPDAAYVTAERAAAVGRSRAYFPGPPDLAVEVVSPDDSRREVREKAECWLAAGTRLVLVADPRDDTVTAYRPGGEPVVHHVGETVDATDVVAGWWLPVADAFG